MGKEKKRGEVSIFLKSLPTRCSNVRRKLCNSLRTFPTGSWIVLKTFRDSLAKGFSKKKVFKALPLKIVSLKGFQKTVIRIVYGKLRSLKDLRLPKRFYSRIGSVLIYSYHISECIAKYGGALHWKHIWIRRLVKSLPFPWISFSSKLRARWSGYLFYVVVNKLFLKRREERYNEKVVIDTSYFFKHHISHGFQIAIFLSLPEIFLHTFTNKDDYSQVYLSSYCMVLFYFLFYIPCIINALLGKYNDMGFISEAVLYWIGDAPEEDADGPVLTSAYWMKTSKALQDYKKKHNWKSKEEEEEEDDLEIEEDLKLEKDSELQKRLKLKLQKDSKLGQDLEIEEYLKREENLEIEEDLELTEEERRMWE